ncbi:MAG: ankyrin repeat domain-containing protein [Gammaproteobacteria bacterium]|nr:ankyrin repeat domain-containing protein [Gammaproteobacteria bacterium]
MLASPMSSAQTPPSAFDYASYDRSFKAVHDGDIAYVKQLLNNGFSLDELDSSQRTALHIAAYQSHDELLKLLANAGGDMNALEYMRYDVITIAAVANDVEILKLALKLGGNPTNVTSLYDGTALIAAAHLGHAEVVKLLLEAGAPVDHINNLGWTALMEAVVLGDGGPDYVQTIDYLLVHDAERSIGDRQGITPLQQARQRGYSKIIEQLSR